MLPVNRSALIAVRESDIRLARSSSVPHDSRVNHSGKCLRAYLTASARRYRPSSVFVDEAEVNEERSMLRNSCTRSSNGSLLDSLRSLDALTVHHRSAGVQSRSLINALQTVYDCFHRSASTMSSIPIRFAANNAASILPF